MGYPVGLRAHTHLLRGSYEKPEQDTEEGHFYLVNPEPGHPKAGALIFSCWATLSTVERAPQGTSEDRTWT